jgi:hypothetical protein
VGQHRAIATTRYLAAIGRAVDPALQSQPLSDMPCRDRRDSVLSAFARKHQNLRIVLRNMETLDQTQAISEGRLHDGFVAVPIDDAEERWGRSGSYGTSTSHAVPTTKYTSALTAVVIAPSR